MGKGFWFRVKGFGLDQLFWVKGFGLDQKRPRKRPMYYGLPALEITALRMRAPLDQENRGDTKLPKHAAHVQWRQALCVLHVDGGASREQQARGGGVSEARGGVERRASARVRLPDVGGAVEQELCRRVVTMLHRSAQGGPPLKVGVVDAGSGLQQDMRSAVMPVLGGRAERGDAPGVGELEVGVTLYEQLHDVVIGILGSKPERASAALSKC